MSKWGPIVFGVIGMLAWYSAVAGVTVGMLLAKWPWLAW
jgi:hypothetical protein